MNETPLVSIIIPVYNGSNYLREAIDSALAQTYSNIEIVDVNDGSCDNGQTEEIALSYEDKIRYISKPNGGVSSALNLGISQMKGEYFSWLSHDDKYTERKVEKQVALLQKYKNERVIALCESRFIDKNSKAISHKNKDRFALEHIEWGAALKDLFKNGTYNGCSFLIPRKYFYECGVFEEELRFAQDTLMWAKILLSKCSIVYENCVGVLSRIHEHQQTQKSRHLLAHDSLVIAEYMVPRLVQLNDKQAIYYFAKRNAKLYNRAVVRLCVKEGRIKGIKHLKLCLFTLYGFFRPTVRKVYYSIFQKVKTS